MKQAYLTIYDGLLLIEKKKWILLNKFSIQAVWFSMGVGMLERPDDTLYTISNGQILGSHIFTSKFF